MMMMMLMVAMIIIHVLLCCIKKWSGVFSKLKFDHLLKKKKTSNYCSVNGTTMYSVMT